MILLFIGCSFLILNISIFALVYFQRDRRRAKLQKSAQQDSEQQLTNNKYSEPPELLKSNRTTASSFLQNSHSQGQLQAELEALELTVKQHQQELLGEKALLGKESLSLSGSTNIEVVGSGGGCYTGTESVRQSGFPKQQQQLPHSYSTQTLPRDYYRVHSPVDSTAQRGILLSPGRSTSNVNATTVTTVLSSGENISVLGPSGGGHVISSQTLAVATLPRCNGSIVSGTGVGGGLSSFMATSGSSGSKPNPPPRSVTNFSTLPRGHQFHGSLKREKRIDYGDNSDSNNENDELKV